MMKNETALSPETVALTAACQLHEDLLEDDAFAGYDGTKEQFDLLYRELLAVASEGSASEDNPVDVTIETWFAYQLQIEDGSREVDWYL